MLATGTAQASTDAELAEVTFDTDTMPQYFYVKAFLVDEVNFRPLSTVYESPMYTQEMQEFLAKTTADFDEDRVLNLDEDDTTNFAVYGEDVVLLDAQEDGLTTDDESGVYTFEDASDRVKNLQEGDVIACGDAEDVVIVSVKGVEVEGDTVKITEDPDAELEDVFEYVKIESDPNQGEAEIDTSDLPEGVTYLGREETTEQQLNADGYDAVGQKLNAVDLEGKMKIKKDIFKTEYEFNSDKKGVDWDNLKKGIACEGNGSISGALTFGTTGSIHIYISRKLQYVEFKLDYFVNVSFNVKLEGSISYRLAKWKHKICAGVDLIIVPSITLSGTVDLSLGGRIEGTVGYRLSSAGNQNLYKAPEEKWDFKTEGKLFFGLDFSPSLSIVHKKIASITATAKLGVQLTSEHEHSYLPKDYEKNGKTDADIIKYANDHSITETIHTCDDCYDISLDFIAKVGAEAKFLNCKWLTLSGELSFTLPIGKYYYSLDHEEFGKNYCPHKLVPVYVIPCDQKFEKGALGLPRPKIINLNNAVTTYNGKDYSVGEKIWMRPGSNRVVIKRNGYVTLNASIIIEDEPCQKYVLMERGSCPSDFVIKHPVKDDPISQPEPEPMPSEIEDKKAVQVAMGRDHGACLTEDGSLYIWGGNYSGQLGDGTNTNQSKPIKIMDNVTQVSLGNSHSACITKDGSLYTWGNNYFGQLGDGTFEDKSTPVKIMSDVMQVSLGNNCSACVKKDGSLFTWGSNYYATLGNGDRSTEDDNFAGNKNKPQKVMSRVSMVELGAEVGACITKNGALYTWGINSYGTVGDGTTNRKYSPVHIMDNVIDVNVGYRHCACITSNGDLYTWGNNRFCQLGDGTKEDKSYPIKIMSNVKSISLGNYHSACITKDGLLYSWGKNQDFQVGNGSSSKQWEPIVIAENAYDLCFTNVGNSGAYISDKNELYSWGDNSFGKLGHGSFGGNAIKPKKIIIPPDNPTTTAQALNADTQKQQTIIPNEVYNVYAVQDINAGLIDDNILYIDQQTADENGKLDYDHGLKGKTDSVVWFAVPMYQQDISGAEVKLDDLEYTGEEQFVQPVVKLDGEELTEGVDYYLEGAYSATEGGEYTVTIKGTGLYTGEVSVTYKVNGGKTAVILGDVNHDEQINVTDIAMIAAHIKGIKALDENAVKAADVNGDTEVNVTDIAMIAAHIKGIKAIG